MARWNTARRVTLLFGVRSAGELYDLPALRVLDVRHDWLTVVPVVQSPSYAGEQGTLAEVVARSGPWGDHDVVVCGSPAMTATTTAQLLAVGVPAAVGPHRAPAEIEARPPAHLVGSQAKDSFGCRVAQDDRPVEGPE